MSVDLFGLTPSQKKRARRQRGRKRTAVKAAAARVLHPHPVPLPVDYYEGPRRAAESERRTSGYTSVRVSKRTLQLLRLLEKQATDLASKKAQALRNTPGSYGYYHSYYNLGLDELLYWDALQRLAQLPDNFDKVRGGR